MQKITDNVYAETGFRGCNPGFVEGKNNRIKTIKRMAYGYRNMDNFRLRILATNSKGAGA